MPAICFDSIHPGLKLLFFALVIMFTMSAFHPSLLFISLTSAFVMGIWLRGGRTILKTLTWQIPLLVIIVAVNPLFSSSGTTEIFRIETWAVYAESLFHAGCMGCMLIATMQWFSNANCLITSEEVMSILGSRAPAISLMITMIVRLIPRFIQRGKLIKSSLSACTSAQVQLASTSQKPTRPRCECASQKPTRPGCECASQKSKLAWQKCSSQKRSSHKSKTPGYGRPPKKHALKENLRTISTLMSWSMEDSLESADSMRSRGWGSVQKRTTFKRYRFYTFDKAVLAVLVLLGALSALCAFELCPSFSFFPTTSGTLFSWSLIPYVLLFLFPALLELYRKIRS